MLELIKIPKENVSDDSVLLVELPVDCGMKVEKNQPVAIMETSKSVFDIAAPLEGYLFYRCRPGDEIPVGEVFAVISDRKDFSFEDFHIGHTNDSSPASMIEEMKDFSTANFSKKALKMIEEKNLDRNLFSSAGMVTEKDVLDYLNIRKIPETWTNKIIILGAGGHGKMCIDIIRQMKIYEIEGIIDDNEKLPHDFSVMGIPLIGRHKDLERLYKEGYHFIINGVGSVTNHILREKLYMMLKKIGFYIPNIIHPKASVEPSVIMGEGNQIMAGSTTGSDVRIGNNCIINSGSVVSHDCILGDNVHIAPGAILAGGVKTGKNTLIGMGSTLYLNVNIGENVTIYNRCNITGDIPDNSIVRK